MTDRNDNSGEIEFTAEARKELDSWVKRAEKELILRARLYAEGRGASVIERRDVTLASRSLMAGSEKIAARRINVNYYLISIALTVSVLAAVAIVYSGVDSADVWSSVLGTVVGVLGLTLTVSTRLREAREVKVNAPLPPADKSVDIGEFIAVWSDIEKILREDGPYEEVETHRLSVGSLVIAYADKYRLGSNFVIEVRNLLRTRNRLVHGGSGALVNSDLRENLQAARSVLSKINNIRATRNERDCGLE